MNTAIEYLQQLRRQAAEFAQTTANQTKTGLVLRLSDERAIIVWLNSAEPQGSIEALLQNGALPLGYISLSDDTVHGKLKVFSLLLEEYACDPAAAKTLSGICRDWALQ